MAGKYRERLTFANVVSVISLLFALGLGSAWAATELSKNEVKSKHIKNRGVKSKDLANNAVTSPKVANGSLLGEDFAAGQLLQGEPGPKGEQGPAGSPDTPAQVLGKLREVDGAGSGLDADQIDGQDSSAFARKIDAQSEAWDPGSIGPATCVANLVGPLDDAVSSTDHVVVTHSESGGTSATLQLTGMLNNSTNALAILCNNGTASTDPPAFTLNVLVLR